jgi:L-lactate dehydrogenase complex protein LldG
MLDRIRAGLHVEPRDTQRQSAVRERLASRKPHLIPARVAKPAQELKVLFRSFLEVQSATVIEVGSPDAVPASIAHYLRASNLPQRLRMGEDAYLARLPWSKEPNLERRSGRARPDDEVGLSRALSAVAETGTLALASGADNPVTLTFLPETQIVVIRARDIVGPYESAFEGIRSRSGSGPLPRTLNLVSGPSRTADVGGRLVTGAHGPRRLCVIIVDDSDPSQPLTPSN